MHNLTTRSLTELMMHSKGFTGANVITVHELCSKDGTLLAVLDNNFCGVLVVFLSCNAVCMCTILRIIGSAHT